MNMRWRCLLVALLGLALLAAGCDAKTAPIPRTEDITTVEFGLGVPMNQGDPLPLPLTASNPADRVVIDKLLRWLETAAVVGKGPEPVRQIGQHMLTFHLSNGKTMSVSDAQAKDEVLLDTGDGQPLHLKSPELAQWLATGWRQDLHLAAETTPTNAPAGIPPLADVVEGQVMLGLPTPLNEAPQPLKATDARARGVIEKVLSWLNSAQVVGGQIAPPSRAPLLVLKRAGGSSVSARPAYDCTLTQRDYGTEERCTQAAGQVIFQTAAGEQRIKAPELAAWLLGGWKQDVQIGVQPSGTQPLTAAAAVDAVFREIGADSTFASFPQIVGTLNGHINIGGPLPGVTIPATFETQAVAQANGMYEVRLVRRWQGGTTTLSTTWTFAVTADGAVHDLGRSGDEPPHIP